MVSNAKLPLPTAWAETFSPFAPAVSYAVDAAQRTVLYWDVMCRRGDQYRQHLAEAVPHVLNYKAELVLDGRELDRPVNYLLVRIIPPADVAIESRHRPFVVVDPRAGHGPGIGGFKADSEIGVALKAGHPCYFVGFLPEPMPNQTIPDILHAEAKFLEAVIARHPQAEGKPCVIGNCQAGWSVMMLAALRPELFGPIIIAGSPLSYWAGVRGQNPMRYTGGLLGGTWLTALAGDLGHGTFDGASLVQNFEKLNPSNTLWTKQYNLYSKIDTEAPRYLEFERWWGGHVTLNAEEMQFIADELFVGNKLAAGEIKTSDGTSIDLRNIRSPIVVFCSKGDNVTPPQQALGWILDLYADVDEIRSFGQTIVYTVHETVGHLGIFVSGSVARKEHGELSSNIDLIDMLPPGLYEAVFEPKSEATVSPDLVSGDWVMRCEARTLDDIRALGQNPPEDERRFATAARVSEANLALYRNFVQPAVRALVTEPLAERLREWHPLRLQYTMFSDANPMTAFVRKLAPEVSENRSQVAADNPFLAFQEAMSQQIVAGLDAWRDLRDSLSESMFLAVYGSPLLQAAVGIDPSGTEPMRKAAKSPLHRELLQARVAELKAKVPMGGLREALVRALLYVGSSRGSVDERGFAALRRLRLLDDEARLTLAEFKALVREQFLLLALEPDAAIEAIPSLLPADRKIRRQGLDALREVLTAVGELEGAGAERMKRIVQLFGAEEPRPSSNVTPMPRRNRNASGRRS